LPLQTRFPAVDRLGLGAALFTLLCHWAGTEPTMKPALCLALDGRPTTLEFRSLGHGITPAANDPAASGGEFDYIVDTVN